MGAITLKNCLLGVEVAQKFVKTYNTYSSTSWRENLIIAHRTLLSVAAIAAAAILIADSAESCWSSDNLRATASSDSRPSLSWLAHSYLITITTIFCLFFVRVLQLDSIVCDIQTTIVCKSFIYLSLFSCLTLSCIWKGWLSAETVYSGVFCRELPSSSLQFNSKQHTHTQNNGEVIKTSVTQIHIEREICVSFLIPL